MIELKTPAADPDRSNLIAYQVNEKANLTYIMNTWILAVKRSERRNIHAQCKAIIEGTNSDEAVR